MGRKYNNSIMAASPMLAADVAQVRNFIDQDLAAVGLSPHPWTWNNVVSGDPVLAVQFKEMRDAIQRLWDFKARGPLPMWSSGVQPGGPSLGTPATRSSPATLPTCERGLISTRITIHRLTRGRYALF